jgi:hypothetical protein
MMIWLWSAQLAGGRLVAAEVDELGLGASEPSRHTHRHRRSTGQGLAERMWTGGVTR